jgi:hypothetical protein
LALGSEPAGGRRAFGQYALASEERARESTIDSVFIGSILSRLMEETRRAASGASTLNPRTVNPYGNVSGGQKLYGCRMTTIGNEVEALLF